MYVIVLETKKNPSSKKKLLLPQNYPMLMKFKFKREEGFEYPAMTSYIFVFSSRFNYCSCDKATYT
jgi:hypothetical protein